MAAININKAQFEQLIHGEKTVPVDFRAPWCRYCAYDRIAEEYEYNLTVVKTKIDDEA